MKLVTLSIWLFIMPYGAAMGAELDLIAKLEKVRMLTWHRENVNAHSSLNVVLTLPASIRGNPPESLVFAPSEGVPFDVLRRSGDPECLEQDFDLRQLRARGVVLLRARGSGERTAEAIYKIAENPGEPGLSEFFFKQVSAAEIHNECANFDPPN